MKKERKFPKLKGVHKMTITLRDGDKISASKPTLNWLSIAFSEASHHYDSLGMGALAKHAKADADIIFDALNVRGFYGEVGE
jgi:hypothetical protein